MHVALVISVPHCGTRFIQNFILEMGGEYIVGRDMQALHENKMLLDSPKTGFQGLVPRAITMVSGHLYSNQVPLLETLAEHWTPICPVVDPLMSIVTFTQRRRADKTTVADGFYMPYMWHMWLHHLATLDPHYVPLDLMDTQYKRRRGLNAVIRVAFKHCEHEMGNHFPLNKDIYAWADRWEQVNTQGDYLLKDMYRHHDIKTLEKEIPDQIAVLRANEFALRPKLEELGYENLMWWR